MIAYNLSYLHSPEYQRLSDFQKHTIDIVAKVVNGDRPTVEAAIAALTRQAVATEEG